MDSEVKPNTLQNVYDAIERSYAINTHLDFFNWLQQSVSGCIPHDVLIACWGNFNSIKPVGNVQKNANKDAVLHYDVASSLSDLNTHAILNDTKQADSVMAHLHQLWAAQQKNWFVINNLADLPADHALKTTFLTALKPINSLLVYVVCDVRGNNHCMYVFLSKESEYSVQTETMALMMPHIDNALRKIQHLTCVVTAAQLSVKHAMLASLSSREFEIIEWIKSGKTNQEIGQILNISQNTVKSHLKRIFQKLNVSKRAQAVAMLAN